MTARWLSLLIALTAAGFVRAADVPQDLESLAAVAEQHPVVLIGEIHGTIEVPALFGALAARLAHDTRQLRVGLEFPASEQKGLDKYLASAGLSEDRAALLASPFWQRDYQDGRSSVAMADLIERLRQIGLKTDLKVIAFDRSQFGQVTDAEREQELAARLDAAISAEPQAQFLVLTGNLHSRVNSGAPWDEHFEFMGHRLAAHTPYALEILGLSGGAWTCTDASFESCKARDFTPAPREPGLTLSDEINERGHHGWWLLPAITASPPARTTSAHD